MTCESCSTSDIESLTKDSSAETFGTEFKTMSIRDLDEQEHILMETLDFPAML